MRFFSIKILVLCILLPPLLYLLTVVVLERQVQEKFARGIEEVSTGDPQPLLDGSVRLRDAVRANIEAYLAVLRHGPVRGFRPGSGVHPGRNGALSRSVRRDPASCTAPANPMRVAQDNFTLLSEGLVVQVEARLEHNRLLSNGILGVYVLAALLVLVWHYRAADRRIGREETERRREIERLQQLRGGPTPIDWPSCSRNEKALLHGIRCAQRSSLHDERTRAERNEDDLIAEIESLEKKLADNLETSGDPAAGDRSRSRKTWPAMKRSSAGRTRPGRRAKRSSASASRRSTRTSRSTTAPIEGLAELNDELRLKAEEVIHQLNSNPDLVTVKRKVFGKKNRETVLEVVFAYKGRLYFRRGQDRRVEVLAVGTKNSQERELEVPGQSLNAAHGRWQAARAVLALNRASAYSGKNGAILMDDRGGL